MRTLAALLPLLLLAPFGAADTTDAVEVDVALRGMAPGETARLGYSSPRPMAIETTVPRFLFEIPEFEAEDPLFFRISLGETKGIPFYGALDRPKAATFHTRLYLDRNRDLDLTNDGEPIEARIRELWVEEGKLVEFLGVTLDIPYLQEGEQTTEPYPCVFYYVLQRGEKEPSRMLVERDGWREGVVEVGGVPYRVALVDDDSDGQYTTADEWAMRPLASDPAELLAIDATRTMLFPAWTVDQAWTAEVKSVHPTGRSATLKIYPAKETERDYFVRVARQRQTEEERRLDLDPLRPKADANDKVDWIENKDVKYALDIASNPRVNKRVLVDFSARTCPWCQKMEAYTFRDREVVQLSKRFVCARITGQTAAQLKAKGDAEKYKVEGTPTYLILDTNGAEIARHQGFSRPRDFAAWLKAALR